MENERKWAKIISDIILEREKKGISQAELSEITGLKQSAISRFESMSVPPQIDTLVKVTNALGLKITIQEYNFKEDNTMFIGNSETEVFSIFRAELAFCKLTVTCSEGERFELITDEQDEFFFGREDGETMVLRQKNRKLIQKIFNWIPIRAELRIPRKFNGGVVIANKDGSSQISNLTLKFLDVNSRNGRLFVNNIKADTLKCVSDNGRVELSYADCKDASVSSDNGRISLSHVKAAAFKAVTDNGQVSGQNVIAEKLDVKSFNGRIVFDRLTSGDLKLWSQNGKVAASLTGAESEYAMEIEVVNGTSSVGGKKRVGSFFYKDKDKPKRLAAYSKNGRVIFVFSDSAFDTRDEFAIELSDIDSDESTEC